MGPISLKYAGENTEYRCLSVLSIVHDSQSFNLGCHGAQQPVLWVTLEVIHFWNCDSYVLGDFSLHDASMSSVAFSKSSCSLY